MIKQSRKHRIAVPRLGAIVLGMVLAPLAAQAEDIVFTGAPGDQNLLDTATLTSRFGSQQGSQPGPIRYVENSLLDRKSVV